MWETWLTFKAVLVAWLGWGFGFAAGIILAVLIAIKEDVVDWIRSNRRDQD